MSAKINIQTETGYNYDIQKQVDGLWEDLVLNVSSFPYIDQQGSNRTLYRVRVAGATPSPWTPPFYGELTDPDLCVLFGYIYDLNAKPISDAWVIAKSNSDQIIQGAHLSTVDELQASTGGNGRWEMVVPQGATLSIRIPRVDSQYSINIPLQGVCNFDSLI